MRNPFFRFFIHRFFFLHFPCCRQNEDVEWPPVQELAQLLSAVERRLAKHVGPEEFLQCSQWTLRDSKKDHDIPSCSKEAPGVQDPKKTCNLEAYVEWSHRLKLLVSNEILKVGCFQRRNKVI